MFMKFKMKKIFCVVLSALMMLSLFVSCGQAAKDKAALSEIAQANATKKLLEVYDSVLITFEDISGMKFGYYVDEDLGYYWVDAYVDTDGETYDAYHEVTTADYQEGREGEKGRRKAIYLYEFCNRLWGQCSHRTKKDNHSSNSCVTG